MSTPNNTPSMETGGLTASNPAPNAETVNATPLTDAAVLPITIDGVFVVPATKMRDLERANAALAEAIRPRRSLNDYDDVETIKRVFAECAALRAEVERLTDALSHRVSVADLVRRATDAEQRAERAEADTARLDWLAEQDYPENVFTTEHGMPGVWTGDRLRARIDEQIDASRAATVKCHCENGFIRSLGRDNDVIIENCPDCNPARAATEEGKL